MKDTIIVIYNPPEAVWPIEISSTDDPQLAEANLGDVFFVERNELLMLAKLTNWWKQYDLARTTAEDEQDYYTDNNITYSYVNDGTHVNLVIQVTPEYMNQLRENLSHDLVNLHDVWVGDAKNMLVESGDEDAFIGRTAELKTMLAQKLALAANAPLNELLDCCGSIRSFIQLDKY